MSAMPWRMTGSSSTPRRRASSTSGFTPVPRPPPPPEPMATRSFISIAIAQRHPSSTSPIRLPSGTRTSVKKTSLNPEPPFICRKGRMSTPGALKSMMNIVMPRCFGWSGFVRAMTAPKSESCAPVVQTF
jgi:hypothetical protein